MISRTHRLTKEQFNAVFKHGVVLRSKNFLIRAVRDALSVQCAVVVAKKVARTATSRNALRRKVFAAVTRCITEKKIPHGRYIIFVLKPTLPRFAERCEEIARTCA
jgi:ribonuclease P protein component